MTDTVRKIIHVDMDCFYAAIEMRDNPSLKNKPIAVGGSADKRGVVCTCNYVARQYGIHSAMPTATAFRHCQDLILLPVNMPKYREVSKHIHGIFHEYTDSVEPIALDEAYLDVSNTQSHQGSATLLAKAIRQQIWETEQLTASAGVASNKLLAKIASDWNKPDGLFVILPDDIDTFIKTLPVKKLHGVGKVTAEKLHKMNLTTCEDLQHVPLEALTTQFGKFGQRLYEQCRGWDDRPVNPNRIRKSLSVETTFTQDINNKENCLANIKELYDKLITRIKRSAPNRPIKNQYIKIKFYDFKQITAQMVSHEINLERYLLLFHESYEKHKKSIRLLGLGVSFEDPEPSETCLQRELFLNDES